MSAKRLSIALQSPQEKNESTMTTVQFNDRSIRPPKIICVGRNYSDHIAEMGSLPSAEMTVFMKPSASIGDSLIAERGESIHYEGEICLLVEQGRFTGVGFGLDLTKRETQSQLKKAGLPWERAKAFAGSALFSDFVSAPFELDELTLELRIDGVLRQQGGVNNMLYKPATILEELNQFLTLEDGDIVMTGTPAGVGPVLQGQRFDGQLQVGSKVLTHISWQAV